MKDYLVHHNGKYKIVRTRYPKNRPYMVVSKDNKLHTHLRTLKEAIDLANFAKYNEIPKGASEDYLISLLRIAKGKNYRDKINKLIVKGENEMIKVGYAKLSESFGYVTSAQDLVDDGYYEEDEDGVELELVKSYSKELKCDLDDLIIIGDEENPEEYKSLIDQIKDGKKLKTPTGTVANVGDLNGMKVITEGNFGKYTIFVNRKDLNKIKKLVK